ncbi:MAG: enoyl-CoA hydratase/isomerase family protein [Proteobacteria bacterium]|nr:enoyl-CoA hydratase/isomerase family protein [Pseudomonadota bacterium]
MQYRDILYRVEDPVAIITMNRPERLNAFTSTMLAEIRHAVAAAERDPRVVGIILTGAGRGFCAGMDMAALDEISASASLDGAEDPALAAAPGDVAMGPDFSIAYTYLLAVRKPVLAAVNGPCAGLGFCFAVLCDMRFVERQAKFSTAFAGRGLVAEHGVSWLLPRLIGTSRSIDILWSARRFDGEEADKMGLADRLCETGTAVEQAREYIVNLSKSVSPASMMIIKQQVYRHLMVTLGPAMEETNRLMEESLGRPDFREGVRSFLEQREPAFKRVSL